MIKIGCCGWGFYKGGLKAYAQKFSLVECQQTFYKLPIVKTTRKWREQVPEGFEISVKAWQAMTHLPTSPTWRRSGLEPTEKQKESYGWLRPSEENFTAWQRTKEICDALNSKVCLIQTPPNFGCTQENINNMRKFLGTINRGKLIIAWEPRGDWRQNLEEVKMLCRDLDLIHVVDIMRYRSISDNPKAYFRLHGLNPREYDYRYNYSGEEIRGLAKKVRDLEKVHEEIYILFNNTEMYTNSIQLIKILKIK